MDPWWVGHLNAMLSIVFVLTKNVVDQVSPQKK